MINIVKTPIIGTCNYFYKIFVIFSQMLRELIPGDLFKIQNPTEWKRTITAVYNQDSG